MSKVASGDKLSNELLKEILDQIESDPDRTVSIDRRAYLSVESFRPPSPPLPSRVQDIGNFRLVCRRFAEIGAPYHWTRVATRLSTAGLARLEKICRSHHLARHTKKFSYLVPFFYGEGWERMEDVLRTANGRWHSLDATYLKRKVDDQRTILESGKDVYILREAMAAFTSLQHVQILRLQDEADQQLHDFLRGLDRPEASLVELKWTPACIHATKTVGEALMRAQSPFSRFSGPMMNTQSALAIRESMSQTVSLASRLTCLELHFDDGLGLEEKMMELSEPFRVVFSAAKSLQALHLGFPSRLPLDLALETIFHNVQWERLRAFGIQAWRLDANEIIDFARRHSRTLKGLRLRDVHLREGSMWKDVLAMLRSEMEQLDWVSLRRIDYSRHFDELWSGSMEVIDDPLADSSDSDDEDDFPTRINIPDSEGESDVGDDSAYSDADTDHGPGANELALSPDTPLSLPFCTCSRNSYPASADDLGDNGSFVFHHQRKMWEKWVIGRCPEHSANPD